MPVSSSECGSRKRPVAIRSQKRLRREILSRYVKFTFSKVANAFQGAPRSRAIATRIPPIDAILLETTGHTGRPEPGHELCQRLRMGGKIPGLYGLGRADAAQPLEAFERCGHGGP
jgi:hypothetical protein